MHARTSRRTALLLLSTAGLAWLPAAVTIAQEVPAASTPAIRSTGNACRDSMIRLTRVVSIEFNDQKLEDIVRYLGEITTVQIEALWADDRNVSGLDKERQISLKAERVTALDLIERILDKATDATDSNGSATWQFTEDGTLQIGPRERLNHARRLVAYDINDLLFEYRDKLNSPAFDLNQALQSAGGSGGGGQAPFQNNQQRQQPQEEPRRSKTERADDIVKILIDSVERDQWQNNGGSGATLRVWQGVLLITAPDYIHRQVDGYSFWPASHTSYASLNNRQYVRFDPLPPAMIEKFRKDTQPAIASEKAKTEPKAPDTK